jgi:phage terminase large subunit
MKERIRTTSKFKVLYDKKHPNYFDRYKVFYGGRAGRKSWEYAQAAITRTLEEPLLVLCTREVQNSIGDSVHALLKNTIERLKVTSEFEIQNNAIYSKNGSVFKFKGLRTETIDGIKSFEGADICWVEEAHSVSEHSWSILIPTIRKKDSQFWIGFNPDMQDDPVYNRFVTNTVPSSYVQKVLYTENPDCPQVIKDEADYLRRVDYEAYAHIYLGEVRSHSDAQVFKHKYRVEHFDIDKSFGPPLQGADWGFSVDPTVLIRGYIKDNNIYIKNEVYKVGCEVDKIPDLFKKIPDSDINVIRGDNARPEIISYLKRHGFNIKAADKWKGSVEDGIDFLRKFENIIIHPDCRHTAEEMRLYSYKVDKRTGDVLPQLEDKHNHCIDAMRYMIEPIIKRKVTNFIV